MTLMYNADSNMLNIKDVSHKLKISERTILREIARGNLRANKAGKKYVFTEADIHKYLKRDTETFETHIHHFCQKNSHRMISLLQKLVSIPAESETDGEERLAKHLKTYLDTVGIRSFIHGHGGASAVHGSFGYADKGLLLDCPLDTTPIGDISKWSFPPYEGVIHDGKMYGRGTADCKAGMVAMIFAILAIDEIADKSKLRVDLVFDGGEQNGAYLGMKTILKQNLPVEAGIVGYAGAWQELPIGARGYHRYTFTSHGESVHTGSKSKTGVNAISNMARFMLALESATLPKEKDPHFPFGCRLTFAQIEGGTAINVVPDSCTARLDVRTTIHVERDDIDKLISKIIRETKLAAPSLSIDYTYDVGQEAYLLNSSEKIKVTLKSSIAEVVQVAVTESVSGPAHIGNLLADYKIPVVIWGPKGANVHSYDEYVEIDSIAKTAEIYARTILKYFSS